MNRNEQRTIWPPLDCNCTSENYEPFHRCSDKQAKCLKKSFFLLKEVICSFEVEDESSAAAKAAPAVQLLRFQQSKFKEGLAGRL